jgi:hypothetical protein
VGALVVLPMGNLTGEFKMEINYVIISLVTGLLFIAYRKIAEARESYA